MEAAPLPDGGAWISAQLTHSKADVEVCGDCMMKLPPPPAPPTSDGGNGSNVVSVDNSSTGFWELKSVRHIVLPVVSWVSGWPEKEETESRESEIKSTNQNNFNKIYILHKIKIIIFL